MLRANPVERPLHGLKDERARKLRTGMDPQDDALAEAPNRRQLLAALCRPLVLALFGSSLIGLLAVLYLNQVAGLAAANAQLQQLQTEQTRLARQNALLHEQLGAVTSPAYIQRPARWLGLRAAPPAGAGVPSIRRR